MYELEVKGMAHLLHRLDAVQAGMQKHLHAGLVKAATTVEREAKRNLSGEVLMVVTGNLRNSVNWRVDDSRLEAVIGTNLVYGPVHEYGAVIRPKVARALHFPVGARGQRINPETWDGPWATVQSVTIPKRPWLMPAFEHNRAFIADIFGHELTALLERGQ
jgi:phage gpG-like protein